MERVSIMKEAQRVGSQAAAGEALGQSESFLDFQERLSKVAPIDRPVLLMGERGTGKELAATRLHYLSKRWDGPFVALNCAALAPSLIESELFGYEKGAFTGAETRRTGRFESADGGTFFLDEIGMIPIEAQEKILRVVEYGTFERVGSSISIEVDVRIVAATNVDLAALVGQGRFKQDLLDRLSFEVLFLPPLRERAEDILLLANHFASRMAFEMGREEIPAFSEEAVSRLEAYAWPGNVRELKNVVERAVYRSDSAVIEEVDFDPFGSTPFHVSGATETDKGREKGDEALEAFLDKPFEEAVRALRIRLLKRALEASRYNQRRAAERLGLTYHQFRGWYRKFQEALE
jgi:psp operon transcriptional activator